MQGSPQINSGQVVLIRADVNTGHVLDENYQIAVDNEQKVYSIFETLEAAVIYAQKVLAEKKGVEIVIYNAKNELLKYIVPN